MDGPSLDPLLPGDLEAAARVAGSASAARQAGASAARAIAVAGLIVTVASLLSRILGYIEYVVIARAVPGGADLDAFFAAFRIPDFLFQLVAAGALASALVPVLAGLFATAEEARAWRVVSTVTTLMTGALLVLAVLVLVLAPAIVPAVITPGYDPARVEETVRLTRIMVLSPLFLAGGAVASSVLNAGGRFAAAAAAPLVYNLGIIGGAIFLVPALGVSGLAVGVVIGAAGHLLVQVPALARARASIRPLLDLRDPATRRALVLLVPRAIGLGATQIVFIVVTSLASGLETTSVTVFNLAFMVLQIPIGVIGVPLGTVLLPSLSREAALGGTDAFRRLLVRGVGMLSYVMIAIAALGIVASADVARILFDFAALPGPELDRIATTLGVFLLGLTAHALIAVLARAFYALQDTATPVVAALLAVGIDIVAAVLLVGPLGLTGLAAAIAVGAWAETVALVVLLQRRIPGLGLGRVWIGMAKALVVAVAGAALAWVIESALHGAWGDQPGLALLIVRATIATVAGGLVILAGSLALRIEELSMITGVVGDLVRRRGRA